MSMNVIVLAGTLAGDPQYVEVGGQAGAKAAITWHEMRPSHDEPGTLVRTAMRAWVAVSRPDAVEALMHLQGGQFVVVRGHLEERRRREGDREVTRVVIIADEVAESMAVAFVKGRLGRDPEVRGESGSIAELRLATEAYSKAQGGRIPVWLSCVSFFQSSSAFLSKHFKKGDDIAIMGTFSEEAFSRKDGSKGVRSQVKILERDFGARRGSGQGGGGDRQGGGMYDDDPFKAEDFGPPLGGGYGKARGDYGPPDGPEVDDDDIPF